MSLHACPSCSCDSDAMRARVDELGRQRVPVYKIMRECGISNALVKIYLQRAGISWQTTKGRMTVEQAIGAEGERVARETWGNTKSVYAVSKRIGFGDETTRRYLARLGLIVRKSLALAHHGQGRP
jgi:hypothetical protein